MTMRITKVLGTALLLAGFVLGGCNNLKEENALLMEENQNLREQLADRNSALDAATMTAREREMEAARLRRELQEQQRQEQSEPQRTGFEGIAGVTGSMSAGEVTATVESDVLFDSGKATLKSAAKQSLDQVANVLNSTYAGRSIRVAGHTDTDPIRKSGHKSNYHLGFERAYAVREYLISRGVPSNRIYLASYGPDKPRGSKAQSRRVEIIVSLGDN